MAFNTYIVLDGKRYKTLAKQWRPLVHKPAAARLTLQGQMEATFGVNSLKRWEGSIIAPPATSDPLYGTVDELRASLRKAQIISFTDHYGKTYNVVAVGPFGEVSLKNVWSAGDNKIYINAALVSADNPA